jgi:hypothetical protein
MRIDHIDSFNLACASVSKLAAEAIAEHRRQIALIESIGREAAALAERTMPELPRRERKSGSLPSPAADTSPEAAVTRALQGGKSKDERDQSAGSDPSDDILGLAMRRAEHDASFHSGSEQLPMFERTSANDFGGGSGQAPASDHRRDDADHERGRGLVAALSGRKRTRRLASG